MAWKVEFYNARVLRTVEKFPRDIRAKLDRLVELITYEGIVELREPRVKHISGSIWEIRLKGKDGIARIFYVTKRPQTVVLLHGFIKKSQKTPRKELEIAKARAKEVL